MARFESPCRPDAERCSSKVPTNDYIYRMIVDPEFAEGNSGGKRQHVHAFVPLDLTLDIKPPDLDITIRRGVTVRGHIVGPDDRPVDEAMMISRLFIAPGETEFRFTSVIVRGEEFELHGLDPERAVPVYFLDAKHELGATVEISGKSAADRPLVVRLESMRQGGSTIPWSRW